MTVAGLEMKTESRVIIVVNRNFGTKIRDSARGVPVWIVATETNTPAIREQWAMRPDDTHFNGITSFNDATSLTPDLLAESMIDDIELHHPALSTLEIIGCTKSAPLLGKLETLGFLLAHEGQGRLRFERKAEEVRRS
jgi:hypothetical protein